MLADWFNSVVRGKVDSKMSSKSPKARSSKRQAEISIKVIIEQRVFIIVFCIQLYL